MNKQLIITCSLFLFIFSCKKDDSPSGGVLPPVTHGTPYTFVIPDGFPDNSSLLPADNPLTVEGIALGRKLFYEKMLSADGTMACATCHSIQYGFTDRGKQFSEGIDGIFGDRNSMPIFNMAWSERFFWDGRRFTLEEQAHDPVVNPIEMHDTWPNVMSRLQADADYPGMFMAAFGTKLIDSTLVAKAIAQFERIIISSNSKFDRFLAGTYQLNAQEKMGLDLFMRDRTVYKDDEGNIVQVSPGADCFHCHMGTASPLLTDQKFHNNGLDLVPADSGLAKVTGNPSDMAKFKTPSLRNLSYTAPYMHDGRFQTIDEVIDFYSENLQHSPTIDPLMKNVNDGGVQLSPLEKSALKAFLKTFDDDDFVNNPDYKDPGL